jgi:hypothetical protein
MGTDPEHGGLVFHRPDRTQEATAFVVVLPAVIQVVEQPQRPFDGDDRLDGEASVVELALQLVWP